MRLCGWGTEDLPWETCGSVDAGGSGEPEVDLPSSSSSESMVISIGGSGTEIPSQCENGPRADIRIHYCPLLFHRDASRNRWHNREVAVSCVISWFPVQHRDSKRHRMILPFSHGEILLHIYGSICAGPRIYLGRRSCIRNTNDTHFSLSR